MSGTTSIRSHLESAFPDLSTELIEASVTPLHETASLPPALVERWEVAGISPHRILMALLPVAAERALAPYSDYTVGCAVLAASMDSARTGGIYLGANLEFSGAPLGQTVHAEQAAVNHAWLSGAEGIELLAVNAAPCGHCRQFLAELGGELEVVVHETGGASDNGHRTDSRPGPDPLPEPRSLAQLLPERFGPAQLGRHERLMRPESSEKALARHRRDGASEDAALSAALDAARRSYAPYTGNRAGAALELKDGSMWAGRYAENAAFNPSLPPLTSAISRARLHGWDLDGNTIARVLLVANTLLPHERGARLVMESIACAAPLETAALP